MRYEATGDPLWYKDAIIYEVHVRAFCDSSGDGNGDFPGLTQKLDYLEWLGVTCLWLLPFYPSPLRDDGYDVAHYEGVHPAYGTMRDFRAFLREAHARGIRVLAELVVNHTSDQHPWFQAARRAPRGSSKRDFYVWSDTKNRYRDARIIFTDAERSNWTWDDEAKAYYWHRFFHHQPDLNYDNPKVLRAVLRIMRFWFDAGVDGLRLDAAPYLIERDGTSCENLPETHDVLKAMRRALDARHPDRFLLAEANQWPADVRAYFGDGDECHMAFHFPLMPRLFIALRQEDRFPIVDVIRSTPDIPATCQWALFLRNHDEMTLEMVTGEERDQMYHAYAADPQMRVNAGIRRRLAPLMENSRPRIELLTSLLFALPGTPIIYYGDEIGMGDNIYLGDRNGVRTPMQWTGDRNGGFSRADPARLYLPPVMDPVYGYQAVNVEAQQRLPSSLLHWVRRLIALRKQHRTFGRGTIHFLEPANRRVLVFTRRFEGEVILVVANLAGSVQPVELDLSEFKGATPVEMLGGTEFPPVGDLPYFLTLGRHAFYWFRLARPGDPCLEAPAQQHRPDREAGTDRHQQHQIALLQPSLVDGVLERERDRGGRGVAEPLEIDDDGALVEAEAVGGGLDDAAVGLVRHEQAHVPRGQTVVVEHAPGDLLGLAHGELEHGGAVLLHVVQPLIDRLVRGRPEAAAGGHLQGRAAAAVDLVREAEDVRIVVSRRRQHHRAGAVAEEHARGAVLVVDDARHDVGADDERAVVRAARDHLQADRQREGEARARRAEVEAPRVHRADLVLQQAGGAREHHVGGRRADDDEADVGRRDARLRDGRERGLLREVGRRHPRVHDVTLPDAGALQDPLVGGVDHLLEVGVGQQPGRHVGGQPGDLDRSQRDGRSRHHSFESFPGAVSPKYSYARGVATRPRGVRSRNPICMRNGS
jgi:trehalose synthase